MDYKIRTQNVNQNKLINWCTKRARDSFHVFKSKYNIYIEIQIAKEKTTNRFVKCLIQINGF